MTDSSGDGVRHGKISRFARRAWRPCARWTAAAAAFAVVGCSTVRLAREAQEAAEAKGDGTVVAAERVDLRGLSLEGLVAFALTNRPSLASARLAVEDARLALKELRADAPLVSATPWTAPHLSLTGGHSEQSAATYLDDGDFRTEGSATAGLSLDVLVWDFGRYNAQARAQAERVVAAERNLADAGFTVFEEVASAYFAHLSKCALLDVALTNAFEYAEHLRRAEARLKAGEAHQLDVLKARLDLAQAAETVVTASNLVTTTGAKLMNALGVDAARGSYGVSLDPPPAGLGRMRRGFRGTCFGVDTAFAFARTNAPAVQVARARLRAASDDVDYAIADLWPKITASAAFSWTDPLWTFKWGVNAAQTVFQGFRKTTAVDRARVALASASSDVDAAEQQLSLDLETAVANRDDSVKAIDTAIASVKSARENLDMVRRQVEIGAASRIELSEAISSLSTAVASGITAFYTGQTAEAKLFRLTGRYPVYDERALAIPTH